MRKTAWGFSLVGIEMGAALVVGMLGGWYLDSKLDTKPILFWVGFALGLAAAAKAVYDVAKKARKAMGHDESSSSEEN